MVTPASLTPTSETSWNRRGFTRIGTASFEVPDEPMADLLSILQELLANHLTEPTPGGGRIDHLWVYLDQPPPGSN